MYIYMYVYGTYIIFTEKKNIYIDIYYIYIQVDIIFIRKMQYVPWGKRSFINITLFLGDWMCLGFAPGVLY